MKTKEFTERWKKLTGLNTWGNKWTRSWFTLEEIKHYHLESFETDLVVEDDKNEN